MGILQHHDAVSGTETQHVTDDYALRLSQGIDAALVVINNAYAQLLPKENSSLPMSSHWLCPLLNISECLPIEKQDHVGKFQSLFIRVIFCLVYHDSMESNGSTSDSFYSCTSDP